MSPFEVRLIGPGQSRIGRLNLAGLELPTPAYVPAFSSARDEDFTARLEAILVPNYPLKAFLVSALDLDKVILEQSRTDIVDKLNAFAEDHVMLLDSGSYEIRKRPTDSWGTAEVLRVAALTRPHVVVSFDSPPNSGEVLDLRMRFQGEVDAAKEAFDKFPHLRARVALTFVIRSNKLTDPADHVMDIANIAADNQSWVDILAFPDVDIGPNILLRCQFARELRLALDSADLDTPIHVMGCSEPLSMVLYTLCGADFFDGNGWWDRTINTAAMAYQDLAYLRLLGCKCAACRVVDWDHAGADEYGTAVMWHNLLQYDTLMAEVRAAIMHDAYGQLLRRSPLGTEAARLLDLPMGES